MSDIKAKLTILLGEEPVGELTSSGEDFSGFSLAPAYRDMPIRPVLGQVFEDDPYAEHRARMRLPRFFSNLLPEGRLRDLIARRRGIASVREFWLLAELGDDLPGAVRAVAGDALPQVPDALAGAPPPDGGQLKFSLAGVQLKFSMIRQGRGLTIPATGRGGNWIVKLPGEAYRGVPENEFSTLLWARRTGIEVPEFELVPSADLAGLPAEVALDERMALAIQRFDRRDDGGRVHIEDFAQVLDVYPHEKYRATNYETVANIVLSVAGHESYLELVRRLAFIVVAANADAHLKNWSFLYPDRVHARLSPAYDLVSTVEFIEQDSLALNLARSKVWSEVRMASFASLAGRIHADVVETEATVRETIRRALAAWPSVRQDAPVSDRLAERLEKHWGRVPLIREAG